MLECAYVALRVLIVRLEAESLGNLCIGFFRPATD
jgi:hypothetical protein